MRMEELQEILVVVALFAIGWDIGVLISPYLFQDNLILLSTFPAIVSVSMVYAFYKMTGGAMG